MGGEDHGCFAASLRIVATGNSWSSLPIRKQPDKNNLKTNVFD